MQNKKIILIPVIINLIFTTLSLYLFLKLSADRIDFTDFYSIDNAKIVIFSELWNQIIITISISIISSIIALIILLKNKKIFMSLLVCINLIFVCVSLYVFLKLNMSRIEFINFQSIENAKVVILNKMWGKFFNTILISTLFGIIAFIITLKKNNTTLTKKRC